MTSTPQPEASSADLVSRYEALAVEWAAARSGEFKRANEVFDRKHALARTLRGSEAGRDGLATLLGHPNVGVRASAATECLAWDLPEAVAVLEDLAESRERHSFEARMTLREYRAGRLNLDW